jgi:hypothetical protein
MNLEEWMDENPPERKTPGWGGSTFLKYKNEILILYEKGYPFSCICERKKGSWGSNRPSRDG